MCSKLLFLIKVDEDISTHTTYHSGIKLTFKWYLMDQPDGNVLQFQAGGLNLILLSQEERNVCLYVCVYACVCVYVCVGGGGVFIVIVSWGKGWVYVLKKSFPLMKSISPESFQRKVKRKKVKWSGGGIWIGGGVERKHCCNYLKSFV